MIVFVIIVLIIITVSVAIGLANSIDQLPILRDLFKTIGFFFSIWFVYNNIYDSQNRETLRNQLKEFLKDVSGA